MFSSVNANDTRPASLQRLDRTCSQLQSMVDEQERAIRLMEKSLKESVTKSHVDILLQGKVTHVDLTQYLLSLETTLLAALQSKLDKTQLQVLIENKVTVGQWEKLREEVEKLKEEVRTGESSSSYASSSIKRTDPFTRHRETLTELLSQIRRERALAREEEVKRKTERHIQKQHEREMQQQMMLQFSPSSQMRLSKMAGVSEEDEAEDPDDRKARIEFDANEKKELRDRIYRMECAIKLAAAAASQQQQSQQSGSTLGSTVTSPRHASAGRSGTNKQFQQRLGSPTSAARSPTRGDTFTAINSLLTDPLLEQRATKLSASLSELKGELREQEKKMERLEKVVKIRGAAAAGAGKQPYNNSGNKTYNTNNTNAVGLSSTSVASSTSAASSASASTSITSELKDFLQEIDAVHKKLDRISSQQQQQQTSSHAGTQKQQQQVVFSPWNTDSTTSSSFTYQQQQQQQPHPSFSSADPSSSSSNPSNQSSTLDALTSHALSLSSAVSAMRSEVSLSLSTQKSLFSELKSSKTEQDSTVQELMKQVMAVKREMKAQAERLVGELSEVEKHARKHDLALESVQRDVSLRLHELYTHLSSASSKLDSLSRPLYDQLQVHAESVEVWKEAAREKCVKEYAELRGRYEEEMRRRKEVDGSGGQHEEEKEQMLSSSQLQPSPPSSSQPSTTIRPQSSPAHRRASTPSSTSPTTQQKDDPLLKFSRQTNARRIEWNQAKEKERGRMRRAQLQSSSASSSNTRPVSASSSLSFSNPFSRPSSSLQRYTPSTTSSFQSGSHPEAHGIKWERDHSPSRMSSTTSTGHVKVERDENGHLVKQQQRPKTANSNTMNSSRTFSLHSASRSRPNSGKGLVPHSTTARGSTTNRGVQDTMEMSEEYSLELLRERLSIPNEKDLQDWRREDDA